MTKVVVLGGGRQGMVIACELAKDFQVMLADMQQLQIDGVKCIQANLQNKKELAGVVKSCDLVVGALPAKIGFDVALKVIMAGKNMVDVCFFAEGFDLLDQEAKNNQVAYLPDCGLAPGLSNLIAGRALTKNRYQKIGIYVGGVAADPLAPLGYRVSWSVDDLIDEYLRPARFVRKGKIRTAPALSEPEMVMVDGVGEMEAFLTDGLRTLLSVSGVEEMTEKTLRWPGHLEVVKPMLASGQLKDYMNKNCNQGDDLVVFLIKLDESLVSMQVRSAKRISAMARATAMTTAAFASCLLNEELKKVGVIPPEELAENTKAYHYIIKFLQDRGIEFNPGIPFL